MSIAVNQKAVVSVVSKDMPLDSCPIGTEVWIKRDRYNKVDKKAMSVLVRHKRTEKWTFIGYVAAKPEYIPAEGINNAQLYDLLNPNKLSIGGVVVGKRQVSFPNGLIVTALVVEVNLPSKLYVDTTNQMDKKVGTQLQ